MGARGRGTAVGAAGGARWAGTVRDWLSRGAQTVGFACAALLGDRYARGEARIVLSSPLAECFRWVCVLLRHDQGPNLYERHVEVPPP